ncbi:tetratricopeptide repeat protein [Candidatus Riflebacteria bacterium]
MILKTLTEILNKEPILIEEPVRVEAFLKDLCPHAKKETRLLVLAARERIPQKLQHLSPEVVDITLDRQTIDLMEGMGLNEESARWAVEGWAKALGLTFQQTSFKPAGPQDREKFINAVKGFTQKGEIKEWEMDALKALQKKLNIPETYARKTIRTELDFARLLQDPQADLTAVQQKPEVDASSQANLTGKLSQPAKVIIEEDEFKKGLQQGYFYLDRADFTEALVFFNQEVLRNPKSYGALLGRARAYTGLKRHRDAISDLNKANELKPGETAALGMSAYLHLKNGDYELSIKDYTRLINFNSNDWSAHHFRGMAYYNNWVYPKAIEDYTRALELMPDNAEIYFNRARAFSKGGQYLKAEADLGSVLKINPIHKKAREELEAVRAKKERKGIIGFFQNLFLG